jgi:hypothetical protein
VPESSVQPPEGLRVIYRYEVPVDDQWHLIALSGPIVHVDGRTPHVVEFWALHQGAPTVERAFRVFGTGQPLPLDAGVHRGTVLAAGGRLVWHLFEHQ